MRTQKVSSNKGAKKTSKADPLKEMALGPSSVGVKSGSSDKKTSSAAKVQPSSAVKPTVKTKGSTAVNSQAKIASSDSIKVPMKTKGVAPASSGKKSHSSSRLSQDPLAAMGETVCREVACEGLATSGGYCRLHYIKNWKKIKRKEVILRERKLNQYIEELVAKYPDKYIEAIRQDLANDKDFAKVIYDLDLDEGVDDFDVEGGDSVDSLIDTIKRDFDDDGDAF